MNNSNIVKRSSGKRKARKKKMSNSNSVKKFIGTKEASEFLGVTLNTIYQLVHYKKFRYYKRGKRLYFRYEDLENYILSGEVLPQSELEQQAQNYLGTREASEFLGVTLNTIYQLVHFKKIRYYKRERRVYFRYEDLESYTKQREANNETH